MWRLGFSFWRIGLYARLGVPAALVLLVIYAGSGFSRLFWGAAIVFACVGVGAAIAVNNFQAREFGNEVGRERVR